MYINQNLRKDDVDIIQNHIALHAMLAHPHSKSMIETGIEIKAINQKQTMHISLLLLLLIFQFILIDRIRSICECIVMKGFKIGFKPDKMAD